MQRRGYEASRSGSPSINWLSRPVEDTPQHVLGHWRPQDLRTESGSDDDKHLAPLQVQRLSRARGEHGRTSPVNSSDVFLLSIPEVPSKTWTTARVPSTSSTWPRLNVPSPSLISTISAYIGFCAAIGMD